MWNLSVNSAMILMIIGYFSFVPLLFCALNIFSQTQTKKIAWHFFYTTLFHIPLAYSIIMCRGVISFFLLARCITNPGKL